jgi:hypothetical protein
MKTCNKCNQRKPLDAFSKKASSWDGLQPSCKVCYSAWYKDHYKKTAETKKAKVAARYEQKAEEVKAYGRAWRANNQLHTEFYAMDVRERKLAQLMKRRAANPHLYREREQQFRKNKPHLYLAKGARRRAAIMNRYPVWADDTIIRFIYTTRRWLVEQTGQDWHVDHHVPLQGRRVSGLHVHFNLRVVPAVFNLSKNNKYEVLV